VSELEHRFEPRRLEVITGGSGRRVWSADAEAAILEETLVPGAVVSAVARRHGVTPQQVFGWRPEARRVLEAAQDTTPMTFVPATTSAASALPSVPSPIVRAVTDAVARASGGQRRDRTRDRWRGRPHRRSRQRGSDQGGDPGPEAEAVIGPSGAVRVMVATRPVDFRKGVDGLSALVRDASLVCPCCAGTLHRISEDVSERLDVVPRRSGSW
jgi:transposase-like protein